MCSTDDVVLYRRLMCMVYLVIRNYFMVTILKPLNEVGFVEVFDHITPKVWVVSMLLQSVPKLAAVVVIPAVSFLYPTLFVTIASQLLIYSRLRARCQFGKCEILLPSY